MVKCRMIENGLFMVLYPSYIQVVMNELVKGHVLPCKRASFTLQKGTFYIAKGHLLEGKRGSFENQG